MSNDNGNRGLPGNIPTEGKQPMRTDVCSHCGKKIARSQSTASIGLAVLLLALVWFGAIVFAMSFGISGGRYALTLVVGVPAAITYAVYHLELKGWRQVRTICNQCQAAADDGNPTKIDGPGSN